MKTPQSLGEFSHYGAVKNHSVISKEHEHFKCFSLTNTMIASKLMPEQLYLLVCSLVYLKHPEQLLVYSKSSVKNE